MEVGADEDMVDGMQCSDHPYRTNPHGICPLCLQEKLGKLLSSSLPLPLRPSSSSSPPSPSSFRSDLFPPPSASASSRPSSSLSLPHQPQPNNAYLHHHSHRPRLPFLSTKKKHKKKPSVTPSSSIAAAASSDVVFKRSKSTATPRRGKLLDDPVDSPRKRNGFWSFLHLSSKSSSSVSGKKSEAKSFRDGNNSHFGRQKDKCEGSSLGGRKIDIVVEDDEAPSSRQTSASSFERKVSRSRSVGCGSRSFSGDFFERISTGFGDCALRRVESQREGKPKVGGGHSMKERARCGGLFSGFMMNSSSSSSSSSSYLVSSSNDDHNTVSRKSESMALSQSRGRHWGWAFASPMRAFTTKPSSSSKNMKNNGTPNLSAIPSLLAVGG